MFSKTPQPPKQAARSAVTNAPGFSILGADMAIKGDVSAASDLHIDGKVTGDITCASLIQGESSEVIGNIKVDSGRLAGIVRGTIDAGDLTILKSAEIHGDVHYDALTIEPGAKVEGRLAVRGAFLLEPSLEMEGAGEPLLTLASANA
jgi:cytoskeletal protein CcmA (bactofilin family)